MSIGNISFSFDFVDHLGQTKNINDNVVDIEPVTIRTDINKLHNTLTMVTNGVYYDPSIIGDGEERIHVTITSPSGSTHMRFFIYSVSYQKDNNIKLICKSKGFLHTMKVLNGILSADTAKEAIEKLLPDLDLNFDNFSDYQLIGDIDLAGRTAIDVVNELVATIGAEYYLKDGAVYFENKKIIEKDAKPIFTFDEINHLISLDTSVDASPKIGKVIINPKEDEQAVTAEPSMSLVIEPSPQPCSPSSVLTYTDDDGNIYKIHPKNAYFYIYYSPFFYSEPRGNQSAYSKTRNLVEEFDLIDDDRIELTGGVQFVNRITLNDQPVSDYYYKHGYNVLSFSKRKTGRLKISYGTWCLFGEIEHKSHPTQVVFDYKFLDLRLKYVHKIELNGYYPKPYTLTISLQKDWGIPTQEAINKSVTLLKYDAQTKSYTQIGTTNANDFGDFSFKINEYGIYGFETSGYERLGLKYFVNHMSFFMGTPNVEGCYG